MSGPAQYIETRPIVTAVQWDGSDEAKDWILTAYDGAAHDEGGEIFVAGAMRVAQLERGTWVVQVALGPVQMSADEFARRYEEAT